MSFDNAQKFCFSVRQLDRIPNLDLLIHRTTSLVERFYFENFSIKISKISVRGGRVFPR